MVHKTTKGYIEVIVGPMFAGKSEELIRRTRLFEYANISYMAFKPKIDVRFSSDKINSRAGTNIPATPIKNTKEIREIIKDDVDAIIIDEIQFLDDDVVLLIDELANRGKRVIVAGLDTDFNGNSFGPISEILAKAEYVTKLKGICMVCGNWGTKSKKISKNKKLIDIDDGHKYEVRCRKCWLKD